MTTYSVKEIYYTIQGEGFYTGKPAVFCRFSGCNLWSGIEEDRFKAKCDFCDTDFVGTDGVNGGKYKNSELLVEKILSLWPSNYNPFVVLTGGEPLLQVDTMLIDEMKKYKIEIAIETNGTIIAPKGLDWICVSPKAGNKFIQNFGDEIKIIYPQKGINPLDYEKFAFKHYSLQPMDGKLLKRNTQLTINYCKKNPKWKVSIQTHKLLGIS